MRRHIALFLILELLYTFTFSTTYRTSSSGNWNDDSNWTTVSPGNTISSGDTIYVDHAITITSDLDVEGDLFTDITSGIISGTKNITIEVNGTLHNDGQIVITKDLDNDGTIYNLGNIEIKKSHNHGYICNSGVISLTGRFDNHGGTLECNGQLRTCNIKIHNNGGSTAVVRFQDLCCTSGGSAPSVDYRSGTYNTANITFCNPAPLHQQSVYISQQQTNDGNVLLEMDISQARSIAGYHLERSIDGGAFEEIGFFDPEDSVSEIQHLDHPLSGEFAYRLKGIDENGAVFNSNTAILQIKLLTPEAILYPNPNNGKNFKFKLKGFEAETIAVKIIDINGHTVYQQRVENMLEIAPVTDLPSGLYILEARSGEENCHLKFLVN